MGLTINVNVDNTTENMRRLEKMRCAYAVEAIMGKQVNALFLSILSELNYTE